MSLPHQRGRQPSPSADAIAGNDDLMTQILIRLPAKSLCRFKCVSKRWDSLISHPDFSLLRMPHSTSGFFLSISSRSNTPLYSYVHLAGPRIKTPLFKSLTLADDPSDLDIVHSCNGLFLLSSSANYRVNSNFYIYNPTTKQFAIIPTPYDDSNTEQSIPSMNLAFDPSKAPHYRIVLLRSRSRGRLLNDPWTHQIEIYSSETRAWRILGDPFPSTDLLDCRNGVFFKGTICWISCTICWISSKSKTSLRFDIDKECVETMPIPTTQDGKKKMDVRYFGESGGHLYLIGRYTISTAFDVLEMESDYSNWFLKYRVDLDNFATTYLDFPPFAHYSVLHLVRGEVEEELSLVLRIRGIVLSYNFKDKSVKKLCKLIRCEGWSHSHHYMETLFRI